MREILFKGKSKKTNSWILGDLIQSDSGAKYILPFEEPNCNNGIEVIPETVSQYIGIKDKVGAKIFESSILKGKFGTGIGMKSTKYKEFNFSISFQKHSQQFHLDMPKNYGQYRFCPHLTDCIVIGNTFDHPELLQ